MTLALFLLTVSDAMTKTLGEKFEVSQILCLRAVFMMVPIAIMTARTGGFQSLRVNRVRDILLRVVLFILTTVLIATSMILLPLADAAATLFAGPLFITALAPWLLGETVGWRRWAAVIVGFVGVLIMLRPTPETLQPLSLIALAAALSSAFRDVITRRISATETTNAIMFWSTLALIGAGAATSFWDWEPATIIDMIWFALSGFLIGSAHYMMIESYRAAEASVVSPLKYTAILWAVALGYFIWGDTPDAFILSGSVLVVSSGLFILYRETRR
ncbi:MAG: DMT family transporter [Alphaproteobacteria bacterium]|nr:DMT family transporter [Alphaproteobacteria bacterium]